ncbi:MAG: hypothetical protein HYT20_01585 [Candidatus Nealsonbacteria bacterium]|nr:hypothetical protein [Candidatus Nealsonbacteria bacterium]
MPEKRENIIYYPEGEGPEEKDAAKNYENEYRQKRAADERRLHSITPEEANKAVKEADKIRKSSRGIMEAEFNDKWLGKNKKEGLKELADWTFTELFRIVSYGVNDAEDLGNLTKKPAGKDAYNDWKEKIEPSLKRLAEEISEIGGQEHILHYFAEEWQPGHDDDDKEKIKEIWKNTGKYQEMEQMKNIVWQIWRKYLNEKR